MRIALIFFYRNYQKLTMRSALLCQAKHPKTSLSEFPYIASKIENIF